MGFWSKFGKAAAEIGVKVAVPAAATALGPGALAVTQVVEAIILASRGKQPERIILDVFEGLDIPLKPHEVMVLASVANRVKDSFGKTE